MLREELTARFRDFEGKEPVDTWLWNGWHAWPVVRVHLALTLHGASPRPATPTPAARLAAAARWRWARARRRVAHARTATQLRAPADVVFLTHHDREQPVGGASYNTIVDPWVEALEAEGRHAGVWDMGAPRGRTLAAHASIQHAIDAARRETSASTAQTPPWLATLQGFAAEALDAEVGWREIEAALRAVESDARVFDAWLERAAPSALVLDCWYDRDRMGASLAAQRRGIPTIDLQHGIQGRAHPAYAGWERRPERGYEVFPDSFAVWGACDAASLVASNPGAVAARSVRVVGNPWLDTWRDGSDPRHAAAIDAAARCVGTRRAVLVTLQKGVAYEDALVPLMRRAPADWLWQVRLHRGMSEGPQRVERQLRRASGRDVDAVRATRAPLYALMRACQRHVTGFSTCALEALAFGVPTLLTHASGGQAYAEFVAQGAMSVSASPAEDVAWLAGDAGELGEVCRNAARRVFADAGGPTPWSDACSAPRSALR